MSSDALQRLAGTALATGSALTVVGYGLGGLQNGTPTPATVHSPVYLASNLLIYAGSVLVVFGLPGLIVRQFDRSRKLTLIGTVSFALITIIDGTSNSFASITLFPMLIGNPATRHAATSSPPAIMGAFFVIGTACGLAGAVVLGISVLRAGVFPPWTGIVMLIGAAAFPVCAAAPILGNLAPILGGIAMIGVGSALVSERPHSAGRTASPVRSIPATWARRPGRPRWSGRSPGRSGRIDRGRWCWPTLRQPARRPADS